MAYQDTVDLTAGSGGLLIVNSAAGATYEQDPFARLVNIKVSGAKFSNFTVSSGGTVNIVSAGNTFSDFRIFDGGKVSGVAVTDSDTTVYSGGSLYLAGGTHKNMTIESGAYVSGLFTNAARLVGSQWNIASGAIFVNGKDNLYTDTDVWTDENGAIHDMPVYGAVHASGVLLIAPKISSYLYVSQGTTVSGGSAAKGGFAVQNGYLYNANVGAGNLWIQTAGAKVSLGGAETLISKGHVYHINCNKTTNQDNEMYASGGVLYGVTLYDSGYRLRDLTILDGLTIDNPIVSSGGTLTMGKGGLISGAVVSEGGILAAASTTVMNGVTVNSGGSLTFSSGVRLSGVTVHSGGSLLVGGNGNTYIDLTVESGAMITDLRAGCNWTGDINIAAGTIRTATGIYAVNGTFYNWSKGTMGGGAIHFKSGTALSGGHCQNQFLYASSSVVFDGVTVDTGTGLIMVENSGYIRNVRAAQINVNTQSAGTAKEYKVSGAICVMGADRNVIMGGADTYIVSGGMCYTWGAKNVEDMEAYAQDGVFHNLKLMDSGNWMQKLTLRDGLNAEAPTVSSGGTLTLSSGVWATDVAVSASGSLLVSSGAAVLGGFISGVANKVGSVFVYDGGTISGATFGRFGTLYLSGGKAEDIITYNAAGVNVSSGADLSDVTMSGGGIRVYDGGVVSNVNMIGYSLLHVSSGARVSGVAAAHTLDDSMTNRQEINVSSGGFVENATVGSGANMNLTSGAAVNGVTVLSGGSIHAVGAAITGLNILTETDGDRMVYLGNGTVVDGGNISGVDKMGVINLGGNALFKNANVSGGSVFLSAGGSMTELKLYGGAVILRGEDAYVSGATVSDGALHVQNGAEAYRITVDGGVLNATDTTATNPAGHDEYVSGVDLIKGTVKVLTGATMTDVRISGGVLSAMGKLGDDEIVSGAYVSGATITGGTLIASNYAVVTGLTATGGAVNALWGAMITDALIAGEATLDASYNADAQGATIAGANTDIAAGSLRFHGGDTGATVRNGVVTGLGANGEYYRLTFGEGITVDTAKVNGNGRLYTYGDAKVYDLQIIGDNKKTASVVAYDDSVYCDTVLTRVNAGAQLNLRGNNKAYNTLVGSGTLIRVDATAAATDTTVMAGGSMEILTDTAVVDGTLTLDYTNAAAKTVKIDRLDRIAATTPVYMTGIGEAGTYEINTSGGTLAAIGYEAGLYSGELTSGGATYTNGAKNLVYSFDGTALTAADAGIGTVAAAAKLAAGATAINGEDLAAKWDATTTYSANVFLADGMTTGNAWLDIDGFANTAANLYGTGKDQDFAGTVNIGANKGTIKNLAAGAALGGKVGGVKLTVEDGMRVTGAVYAGGMGDVTGATETLVEGGAFGGNVFAGALCNYVANTTATAAGDINLTVNGGTFANNIYAGAAVKAGAATGVVHTAGDIAVELNDGTASRPSFCVYGGGYATGTTESKVYAAGDVDITVTGGSWGKYQSGRGIFGGVYTDKVAASVENVSIAVSGGTLGNIYGGGWAQNGGTSTAGNVSITVSGDAEVNNVFGGGCYSTTGGATGVGNVEIVVAGGSIANNIFAGGFGENSTVAGDVSVTFRGSNAYSCNVYGYITPENAASAQDKLLSFDGFTGSVAGAIGGFDSIEFANDTAATLSGAIDNGAWSFDYTGRTLDTAAVALTDGTFTGDALTLKLDATDAPADWNIASGLADTAIGFDYEVYVGGAQQTFDDDGKIASGDYAGWGFDLNEGVLKFKNLA